MLFPDSPSKDKQIGVIWLAFGLILFLVALGGCIFKRMRWTGIFSLLILVITGLTVKGLRSHRLATGVLQLEAIYREIAARGPPFPKAIAPASYNHPAFLHWYYQRNSDHSFAIVYIVSSDGWTMEYPDPTWRWIGYQPDGYKPKLDQNRWSAPLSR
jgi:hypothetical protein